MSDFFGRQAARFNNDMNRSCGALLGIAQGMLSDGELSDVEIGFLRDWLANNEGIASIWPGSALYSRVQQILADGLVTEDERAYLMEALQKLVGGTLEDLAQSSHVSDLALDDVASVGLVGKRFCLTGDFAYGARPVCERLIAERGGEVIPGITKKLDYLVVGGFGSQEWKHGSFGTKIAKAMEYKAKGVPILIVHEDVWVASIRA